MIISAASEGVTISTPVIISVITVLGVAIGGMFKLLISSKDKIIADKEEAMKSYREAADESIKSAQAIANHYRAKEGKEPILLDAPVISESHSPSTALQRRTADIATMRASLAKIKLLTGQMPRPEPEQAKE